MVTHQLQVRCRPVKVRRSETDVLATTEPPNQQGFNAGQTHSNTVRIYLIFNRLRAIERYWSEIATFSYTSLPFNAPVGGVTIGIPGKSLVLRKLESWGYLQAVKTV